MTWRRWAGLLALSFGLWGWARAESGSPWLELVESVPLETEKHLDDPSIRSTAEVWLELVQAARRQLDLEFFYLRNEVSPTALTPVIEAIEARAGQGVRVRALVDARFVRTYPQLVEAWPKRGIEVRQLRLKDGVQHGKLMLVDQQRFFLGSQNFDWTALTHIRELGIWGRHPELAARYQEVFDADWDRAGLGVVQPPPLIDDSRTDWSLVEFRGSSLRARPSWSPGSEEQGLVQLLRGARKRISLQVMTYSPAVVHHDAPAAVPGYHATLDQELRAAATRGVQVQLLVADWGLKPPHSEHLVSLDALERIEVRCSRIPRWSGGEVAYGRVGHSKYLVIDQASGWVGTSNWERSYFHDCRDFGLMFEGASLGSALQQFFDRDWAGPYVSGLNAGGE